MNENESRGYTATHPIRDEATLRLAYPAVTAMAQDKCLSRLDRHARDYISRSPFVCVGTQSADGHADVSPRGDPAGFVKMLDDRTLALPDRPGNNRLDSFVNILSNPAVGLLFMIPGFHETLRVNGRAQIVRDPELLTSMAVAGRAPSTAIVVDIESVFLHCAKALRRARLWDSRSVQNRSDMPSLARMILDQTGGAPSGDEMRAIDKALEVEYAKTMY